MWTRSKTQPLRLASRLFSRMVAGYNGLAGQLAETRPCRMKWKKLR